MITIDNSTLKLPASLVTALGHGETLALTGQDGLMAFVIPAHPPSSTRPFGLAKGQFSVPADFNESIPELEEGIYES